MCFWPSVSCACVGCAVCAVSAALSSWVCFCCDCLSCTCYGIAGCLVSLLCPLCCSYLLSALGVFSAAFCHLGLLSHPILLLFLAWVSSFGVCSGLGLRCCGLGYGSSLLFFFWGRGGGGLSFPGPCCFSLAITTFSFCLGNLGFLDFFLLEFLSTQLPVFHW